MPLNLVIQQQRKTLGLTQEQVASYLGVSTPAVNKWEKGATCPDLSLLPPLARLLHVDLNTLLCFQEELSQQEIGRFTNEVAKAVEQNGVAGGFAMAEKKIQEYPNCESLLYSLTLLLDGALLLSRCTPDEKKEYMDKLYSWYARSAKSENASIRNAALFMLVSKHLSKKESDQAQELLDLLPKRSAIDKRLLQAEVLLQKNKMTEAAELMEGALLSILGELQNVLIKLVDIETAAGDTQAACKIAEVSHKAVGLFDLWDYGAYVAPFQLALAQQDAAACIPLLRKLLAALCQPWNMQHSLLYRHIAKGPAPAAWDRTLPPLLADLEDNPKYSFLRGDKKFQDLIAEYRKKADWDPSKS